MPIPKYVERLLQRRKKLAMELQDVSAELDDYCEKIGVDMFNSSENSLLTDVSIYCEPWNAIHNTRDAIEKALKEMEK